LVTRTGEDPEAQRHRADAGHPLGDDAQAGAELRASDRHRLRGIARFAPAVSRASIAVARPAIAVAIATRRPVLRLLLHPLGNRPLLAHGLERDLPAIVDVLDLDLDRVADLDRVLDVREPLALAELGDVDQAVAPRHEVHERTERGRVDHGAGEVLADADRARVRDLVDDASRLVRPAGLASPDEHGPVVLDVDVGAGQGHDLVDLLALGTDHLADLVHRDPDREDPRRLRIDLGPGLRDRVAQYLEDLEPRLLRLFERAREHLAGQTGDLHVELD